MGTLSGSTAMEGNGAYNRNSWVQAHGLRGALDLLRVAAETVPLPPPGTPLAIADYGAAGGRNSLLPMAGAIAVLRRRLGPDHPISVIHTDLPGNDFTALFETLEGAPDSYLGDPAVFACAVGRSFFGQILPPDSVTLGWSSWAVHWLSRAPCPVPDAVHWDRSKDARVRAAFAEQAAGDWRRFLHSRARELRPGGRLVITTVASEDAEPHFGPLFAALTAALAEMVTAGEIGPDERAAMLIPTAARNAADYAAPFQGPHAMPNLRLEVLDICRDADPVWLRYQESGDAAAWAADWTAFMRAAIFPSLAAALAPPNAARRDAFFTALEARCRAHLSASPAPMGNALARMTIVRDDR